MARRELRATLRRHWLDLVVGLVLLGGSAALVALRAHSVGAAGGLQLTWRQGETVLGTRRVPQVDLHEGAGPWIGALRRRPGAVARYQGYLYVPYRGHFVLALWLRGSATLTVGQTEPIRARSGPVTTQHGKRYHPPRLVKAQRLLPEGWIPLTLQYSPPRAPAKGVLRLLWQPPGRRGDPDYVVSAVLRPAGAPPEGCPPAVPTRRDFFFALGLLALGALCLAVWGRRRLRRWLGRMRSDPAVRLDAGLVLLLGVTALAVRLWGIDAAGQTWDEDVYFGAGRNLWENLLSLDVRPESWAWNLEHPPITKYVVGLGALAAESMTGARVVSALCGAASAGVVFLLGREASGDRRVGLLGGALVGLLPHLVAHSRIAGHESVSVLLWGATALAGWHALCGFRPNGRAAAVAGLLAGLAVGARLVNVSVFLLLAILVLPVALRRWRDRLSPWDRLPHLAGIVALAGVLFLVVWPRLWTHTAFHLGELLTYWPPGSGATERFLGRSVRFHWAYFPVYAVATTPTVVLVGAALFLGKLLRDRRRGDCVPVALTLAPLSVGLLVPFCRDGVRYVLPVQVGLALAAAVGTLWALDRALARWRAWRQPAATGGAADPGGDARRRRTGAGSADPTVAWLRGVALGIGGALLLGPTAWALARFHPYLLDYYNLPTGGPRAALYERRFEWSWWGEGLAAGVRYLNRHAPRGARIGVDVVARHTMVLRTDLRTVAPDLRGRPDYLLVSGDGLRRLWDPSRRRWQHPRGYRVVFEERVAGLPLVRVYRRQ